MATVVLQLQGGSWASVLLNYCTWNCSTDMASGSIYQPPERSTFSKPEGWPSWIKRFEWYAISLSLDLKEEERQVSSLIYTVWEEVECTPKSFRLPDAKQRSYKTVRHKLKLFFVKKRNIVFDCITFFQRRQEEGEPVASFVNYIHA